MQKSFERCLVEQCAPTLAGVKPGSLYQYSCQKGENLEAILRHWNQKLEQKGLRVCLMRAGRSGGLIYVYRPGMLAKILSEANVRGFLGSWNYSEYDNLESCIRRLRERFADREEFPHEIGIFLGYPLEDVKGFIENKGGGYSLCGPWKVYGDRSRAERMFARYRKCRDVYKTKYDGGQEVMKLVVSF